MSTQRRTFLKTWWSPYLGEWRPFHDNYIYASNTGCTFSGSAVYSAVPPTPSNTATPTQTMTPSETPTLTPTNTQTSTPTNTPSNTPTKTPEVTPTNTPSNTPSETAVVTPTVTSTQTNTPTTTTTLTASPTVSPSQTPSTTPNSVCPNEVYISGLTNPLDTTFNGTYYFYQIGYFNTTTNTFVSGNGPDGNSYIVYKENGVDNFIVAQYNQAGNQFTNWIVCEQLNPPGYSTLLTSVFLNDGTYYYPRSGSFGTNGYLYYPSVCPTNTPTCTPTLTRTPAVTPTITTTNTSTPTNTPTPSVTPVITFFNVCETNANGVDYGTYNRVTTFSGSSSNYGYLMHISNNQGYYLTGTAPDGFNYPVYQESTTGPNFNTWARAFSFGGFVNLGWSVMEQITNPLISGAGYSGGTVWANYNTTTAGNIRIPQSGFQTFSGGTSNLVGDVIVNFSAICPTPTLTFTPTNSATPTPSVTKTPTLTPTATRP